MLLQHNWINPIGIGRFFYAYVPGFGILLHPSIKWFCTKKNRVYELCKKKQTKWSFSDFWPKYEVDWIISSRFWFRKWLIERIQKVLIKAICIYMLIVFLYNSKLRLMRLSPYLIHKEVFMNHVHFDPASQIELY